MRWFMASSMAVLAALATVAAVHADHADHADHEWEQSTTHYEDDAWYDVSEWFDGNDYNPTDEEVGEWDDETFHESDEIEANSDNDVNYGYNSSSDDDNWFYDYYDEGAYTSYDHGESDNYDAGSRFFDYDNDGSYDGYSTFYDWDEDGLYDDYNYYFFSEEDKDQEKTAKTQTPTESRKHRLTGEIQKTKQVHVRGGQNLVAVIKSQDKEMLVDLGRADGLKTFDLKEGDKITVGGYKTHIGDKLVLVAQSLQAGGQQTDINRDRLEIKGKVLSTHKTNVRGSQHLIAMVNTGPRKGRIAVDLGPAKKLDANIDKGAGIIFRGVPINVKDKNMMMALFVQDDRGRWSQIDRRKSKPESKSK